MGNKLFLIFPILGMGFGFFGMWLRHKLRTAKFELLRTYINQGKEPPAVLLQVLQDNSGPPRRWRGVAIYGSLAVGFGLIALLNWQDGHQVHADVFVNAAIILGTLTIGLSIYAIMQAKHENK